MELREALLQIDAIHAQISRAETFRGYRAASVGSTALLAFATAGIQAVSISDPAGHLAEYLQLWIGAAFASVTIVALELAFHCLRSPSQFAQRQTWQAIGQFLPCLVAGALLTWTLCTHAPESATLLPGLWAIVFSLGIFASLRQLPREVIAVAIYYLGAGIAALAWAKGPDALSPWAMAGTFGVGQLLTTAILYWTLERRHG
jgi:hypothetical protein